MTTTILAADDLMTMGNNIKTYVQAGATSVIIIGGLAFITYRALKSKFSPTAIAVSAVGVIAAAVVIGQLVGWVATARNSAPSVTGVQNSGTYSMAPRHTDTVTLAWSGGTALITVPAAN